MKRLFFLIFISLLACTSTETYDLPPLPTFPPIEVPTVTTDSETLAKEAEERLISLGLIPPLPDAPPEDYIGAKVTEVIDADTVDVLFKDGTTDRVRLLGVDVPETNNPNKANEYGNITNLECLTKWGNKANDYAEYILEGKEVKLILDEAAGDRGYYGRLLAYIEIDGYDFNETLINQGYARVYEEGTATREKRYMLSQDWVMTRGTGLWGDCEQDSDVSGASARCKDGTLSYSKSRRGTCSWHGGIAEWFK